MKYKNVKEIEFGDVCIVHPVKKIWLFRKGSKATKPYYVYIRYEHIDWESGKKLELVSRIPNMYSCVINENLLKRMEYVGNLVQKPNLFKLIFNQKIS